MDDTALLERMASARVARLGTVGIDGQPHLVPISFAIEDRRLFFAVDAKPKRTTELKRLRNIGAHPQVAVLVDHYEDDWTRLWWVRADGSGRVLEVGAESDHAIDLLVQRYAQYRRHRPAGPAVAVSIEHLSGWSAT